MIPRKTYDQTKRGSPHERLQHAVEEIERDAYETGFREARSLT